MNQIIYKYHQNLTLFGILFLGLIIRLWRLGAESAWIDEAYSIQLARYSLLQIIQGTAADQHPPLYYFLLHFWLMVSNEIWNARFLSVLLGVFNIWQVFCLGTKIQNKNFGLISGLVIAVMPMHIYYSQEVRMYMLLLVILTASTSILWDWLKKGGILQWIEYVFLNVGALYTHNFSVFIFFVQAILIVIWSFMHHNRKIFFQWVASMIVCLLGYLPWLPVAYNQLQFHKMNWLAAPTAEIIRDTFFRLIFGFPWPVTSTIISWLFLIVIITSLLVFTICWFRRKEKIDTFLLVFLWVFFPYIAIVIIAIKYPIFQYKQFIIITPAVVFLLVLFSKVLPKWIKRIFIAGIVILYLVVSIAQGITLSKDDWRSTAEYIRENYKKGDIVFGNPSASSLALSLYSPELSSSSYAGYPPNYDILKGGWAEGGVINSIRAQEVLQPYLDHHRIWLVEFSPQLWDPETLLPQELALNYNQVLDLSFTRIRLRLYTVK